ncbi:MAG: hypothetical protein RMN25_08655 [Anaerolineae bacterium]|nr:hypothetical protein [Thermoflexales bacterium]MDW8407843.1 hypothetical protein [Anaerolineae bacterium]
MDAVHLDAALERWLTRQPNLAISHCHVQIKLEHGDIAPAQRATLDLPGWVLIDWGVRGTGLSAKRAMPAAGYLPTVGRLLEAIDSPLLRAHIQIVIAPAEDWNAAYSDASLAPDLMPVIDAGHATLLNLTAVREQGNWRVVRAYQPPSENNIANEFRGVSGEL